MYLNQLSKFWGPAHPSRRRGRREKTDMREVKALLGSIESYIAKLHGDQMRTSIKLNDIMQSVERLNNARA